MSQIWPVSLDVGNSMVKGVRGNSTPTVFPNLVANDNNNAGLRDFAGFSATDPLIIEMDDLSWAVGYSAEELSRWQRAQVGYTRYDNNDFDILVAGVLGEMYPTKGGTLALTFSLPVDGFGQAAVQVERMSGEWSFVCRGRELNFEIPEENILPVPEGFGSICYFLLSHDGSKMLDLELAESRVAVIDIGGYTTDILTFRELNLAPVHGSIERGIIQVRNSVNSAIKHKFKRPDLQRSDVEQIIKTRKYKHRGRDTDVTDIVEPALWDLTQDVLAVWNDPTGLAAGVDYDAVIFTGGGAPLIRPFLEAAMKSQDVLHENILRVPDEESHLANAVGAYRFASFKRHHASL